MIVDASSIALDSVLQADLCIVGAGAAGITIARELAGPSIRVVVLESGGLDFEAATNDLDVGDVVGLPYFPLEAARLRYLGGSTNHWGGVCRPLEDADFEARDWIPKSGWPITRADVASYYSKAASIAGLTIADWDLDRWRAKSPFPVLPVSGDPIETVVAQVVDKHARSFGTRFRKDLTSAEHLQIVLHANAVSIDTDEAGRSVSRIRAATLDGGRFSITARAYVIATGGIENARLMLASTGTRPYGIGNEHGLVGRHFMEHPRFQGGVILPTDRHIKVGFYDTHHASDGTIEGYLTLSSTAARRERLTDVQIRLVPMYDPAIEAALDSTDKDAARDLVDHLKDPSGLIDAVGDLGHEIEAVTADLMSWRQAVVAGGPLAVPLPEVVDEVVRRAGEGDIEAALPLAFGDLATVGMGKLSGGLPLVGIGVVTRVEQVPNADSRITLSDERDALGMPRAKLDWRLGEVEKRSAVRAMELLAAELARTNVGRVRIDVDEDPTSWPDDLAGGWHHMGTTRMSDDPTRGVVDRDCRIHGMDGIYVAGSSVFATAGSGTPTMTIVALALRLADHLRTVLA